jgi:hypothetical protein
LWVVRPYPYKNVGSAAPTRITRTQGRRDGSEQPCDIPPNQAGAAARRGGKAASGAADAEAVEGYGADRFR